MFGPADEKLMKLRYDSVCRVCGAPLPACAEAIYERSTKTVRRLDVLSRHRHSRRGGWGERSAPVSKPARLDAGVLGPSARRSYERLHAKSEQQIREKHPRTARFRV